jgi:hypothetical protein
MVAGAHPTAEKAIPRATAVIVAQRFVTILLLIPQMSNE